MWPVPKMLMCRFYGLQNMEANPEARKMSLVTCKTSNFQSNDWEPTVRLIHSSLILYIHDHSLTTFLVGSNHELEQNPPATSRPCFLSSIYTCMKTTTRKTVCTRLAAFLCITATNKSPIQNPNQITCFLKPLF